jgi:hypothetical protein
MIADCPVKKALLAAALVEAGVSKDQAIAIAGANGTYLSHALHMSFSDRFLVERGMRKFLDIAYPARRFLQPNMEATTVMVAAE